MLVAPREIESGLDVLGRQLGLRHLLLRTQTGLVERAAHGTIANDNTSLFAKSLGGGNGRVQRPYVTARTQARLSCADSFSGRPLRGRSRSERCFLQSS